MTTPASGPISIGNIMTELAIGGATSLGQANVRTLLGRPSGQVALSDDYNKSNGGVVTPLIWSGATTILREAVFPTTITVSIRFNSNGTLSYEGSPDPGANARWFGPSAPGISYWVRANYVSGTNPGSTGVWQAVSGSPIWGLTRSTVGSVAGVLTFQVSTTASDAGIVATSPQVTLQAFLEQ